MVPSQNRRQSDEQWMGLALALSKKCPPTDKAFSVGAIIVSDQGINVATGFSREHDYIHAEEAAIEKLLDQGVDPTTCTLYSTMEPCSKRLSGSVSCTEHIVRIGIPRVCFALREPPVFVHCTGAEDLQRAGVEVVEMPEWAEAVEKIQPQFTHKIS